MLQNRKQIDFRNNNKRENVTFQEIFHKTKKERDFEVNKHTIVVFSEMFSHRGHSDRSELKKTVTICCFTLV